MSWEDVKLLRIELNKLVPIQICYIYETERILKPLVHYQIFDKRFRQVKILGRVLGTHTQNSNGNFIITVHDGTSEIQCIIPKDDLVNAERRKLSIQKKMSRFYNSFNIGYGNRMLDEARMLAPSILEMSIDAIEEQQGIHQKYTKDDYVVVIGNIGPHKKLQRCIYAQKIIKIPFQDDFIFELKRFTSECKDSCKTLFSDNLSNYEKRLERRRQERKKLQPTK